MDNQGFTRARRTLEKTQAEMAQLLGVSVKAVHSYEQAWRRIPPHVERQVYFLLSRRKGAPAPRRACWTINRCPPKLKNNCPAWEFQAGDLCWFINGTVCEGRVCADWEEKMEQCRKCPVLLPLIQSGTPEEEEAD